MPPFPSPFLLLRSARRLAPPVAGSVVLLGLLASTSSPLYADSPVDSVPHPFKEKKVFYDEDGKPCKACTSFSSYMKTGPPSFPAKKKKASSSEDSTSQAGAGALAAAGAGGGLATLGLRSDEELAELRKNCPPDIEELGRATWTLLHTLTSSLPSSPSPTQQTHLTALLTSLTILYPCPHCRADFAAKFAAAGGEPALREAVKTREGAERWVWERHEEVNRKLGKEGGVGVGEIRVRWKEGGEGCGW